MLKLLLFVIFLGGGTISAERDCADTLQPILSDTIVTCEDSLFFRRRTFSDDFLQQFRDDAAFDYKVAAAEFPNLWQQFKEWLMRHLFHSSSEVTGIWLEVFIKVSVVLLLIFLIYKLILHKFNSPFSKKDFRLAEDEDPEMGEVDDISYPMLLEKAVLAGNYSMAIRIHYLYTLYLLDEKGVVHGDRYKSNMSYFQEIQNDKQRSEFQELSRIFNCVCYGEFEVGELVFQQVEQRFRIFQEGIER